VVQAALAELCQRYWLPLYGFVRRRGHDPETAADLTQSFFAKLLESNDLTLADPARGRFRSFLLAAMSNFIANHWRAERAQKRGGGAHVVSLDMNFADGESRYRAEPAHSETAERLFERRWALSVLEQALTNLRDEMTAAGKGNQFAALRCYLDDSQPANYEQTAQQLGMTEVAVRVAVHRLKEKYRRHLRGVVAQTIAAGEDIDAELQDLLAALESGL
jgi:RNA polymerase sigma-70 factor (ECF subfamily)